MQKFKRIGVLTSGGDAPGMNAAIRAITCAAIRQGVEVMGVIGGYSGLINEKLIPLTTSSVANLINRGGTALFSDRCLEFKTEEGMQKAIATCKKYNIDAIIAIGGDGTFRGATDLSVRGIPTIGVTGTIDNDITATDYTVGFDTAMNTVVNIADQFRDTCQSHARCNVIEVMGRDCGWIALMAGIASGAVAVAIPEIPFDEAKAIEKIKLEKSEGNRGMLVIVSEGVFEEVDGKKVPYGELLRQRIEKATGIETKFARLAHVVRGGSPSLRDRFTASKMGVRAVELLLEGKSDLIIAEEYGKLVPMDIQFALTVDRMYKNKLKDGDLDKFSAEDIERMKDICAQRTAKIERYYNLISKTS